MIVTEKFSSAEEVAELFGRDRFLICVKETYRPKDFNPLYHTGFDLRAGREVEIEAGETAVVPTGVKIAFPVFTYLSIVPRSGLSLKTKLRIANSPGTVEAGYRNEVGVILENAGNFPYRIGKGERIAQAVPMGTVFAFHIYPLMAVVPLCIIGSWKEFDSKDEEVMEKWFFWINLEESLFEKVWKRWSSLFPSERGEKGYGSTGRF